MSAVDALQVARDLIRHGAPIFAARPAVDEAGAWIPDGGTGKCGYWLPKGWENTEPDEAVIEGYRPGDALGMVQTLTNALDVDPRHGGDDSRNGLVSAGLWPLVLGVAATPSGGTHELVAPLQVGSRDALLPGLDVKGSKPDGSSRGFVFIAPTVKLSKATGELAPYVWTVAPMLDELDPADDTGEPIAEMIRECQRGRQTDPAEAQTYTGPAFAELPEQTRAAITRWTAGALTGIEADLAASADWPTGHTDQLRRGWERLQADEAYRLGRLARASWNDLTMPAARAVFLRAAPTDPGWTRGDVEGKFAVQSLRGTPAPLPASIKAPGAAPSSGHHSTPIAALGALLADLRTWQHLPDPTHVIVSLATAATRGESGEACWLLLVAPPSSGKTEAVRILDDAADARLDEVSAAGLLGWSKGKTVRPSGVLTRVGDHGLVTFGDLSTLLATSDRGGRDQVFGLMRSIYDGHAYRGVQPPGKVAEGQPDYLEWSGRLTVVACVTGAIDRYTAHADQLGARWVYVRLPDRSTPEKRRASKLARRGGLAEHRARSRAAVVDLLATLPEAPPLPEAVADEIEDAALVTAWGRGSVPRNGYGRREIEGVPVVEEPMRLVQQLGAIGRGVLALGLSEDAASAIVRRVALDSMPESRRAVLAALATGELLSGSAVARVAGIDRKVARFQLEELACIGVVTNDRINDEDEERAGITNWSLNGEDGALIADVFSANMRGGGWDETWVYTSTSPPIRDEETPPSGGNPTLRPTPGPADEDLETVPNDEGHKGHDTAPCSVCGEPLPALRHRSGYTQCRPCEIALEAAS